MAIIRKIRQEHAEKMDPNIQERYIKNITNNMNEIYTNKSSDEYKCKGDITKSPNYETIEFQIATLSDIHGYPADEAQALKDMFNALHRPIFPKMVMEYLTKPDERNIIFTAVWTVGYRLLISELSRVITATEATEKGMFYKPDKVSRKKNEIAFIKKYNKDLDKRVDDMIKKAHKDAETAKAIQEAATFDALLAGGNLIVGTIEGVFGFLGNIFKSAASLNPVSLISACLTRSYDKKVEKYNEISKEYEAAKKAYDEYKKIPEAQRQKKIEHRYVKMIEKYNIKMLNLKAKIDHYDQRAHGDDDDAKKNASKPEAHKNDAKPADGPTSSSTVDNSSNEENDDLGF